jgi:monoterpene epsilon-lactone hydrolase
MTGSGDTEYTNVRVDTILKDRDPRMAANYAGGHHPKDPLLSLVYADYSKGFVPSILTSGTRDVLLSGTVRLHRALVSAGIEADACLGSHASRPLHRRS